MLYLEDYLELIETLPAEIKERLNHIRQEDVKVTNTSQALEDRVNSFFKRCLQTHHMEPGWKASQNEEIMKDFESLEKMTNSKVEAMRLLHDTVQRYVRRLDSELDKFTVELEADHAGITASLTKRSLDLDRSSSLSSTHSRAEKKRRSDFIYEGIDSILESIEAAGPLSARKPASTEGIRARTSLESANSSSTTQALNKDSPTLALSPKRAASGLGPRTKKSPVRKTETGPTSAHALSINTSPSFANASAALASRASSVTNPNSPTSSISSEQTYASAQSQAVSVPAADNTLEGTKRPRRARLRDKAPGTHPAVEGDSQASASLQPTSGKAAIRMRPVPPLYADETEGEDSTGLGFGGEFGRGSDESGTGTGLLMMGGPGAQPGAEVSADEMQIRRTRSARSRHYARAALDDAEEELEGEEEGEVDNKKYCVCQQVSFGDMVACDNPDCEFEWFHFSCVGLTSKPKGKWYCPRCRSDPRFKLGKKTTISTLSGTPVTGGPNNPSMPAAQGYSQPTTTPTSASRRTLARASPSGLSTDSSLQRSGSQSIRQAQTNKMDREPGPGPGVTPLSFEPEDVNISLASSTGFIDSLAESLSESELSSSFGLSSVRSLESNAHALAQHQMNTRTSSGPSVEPGVLNVHTQLGNIASLRHSPLSSASVSSNTSAGGHTLRPAKQTNTHKAPLLWD